MALKSAASSFNFKFSSLVSLLIKTNWLVWFLSLSFTFTTGFSQRAHHPVTFWRYLLIYEQEHCVCGFGSMSSKNSQWHSSLDKAQEVELGQTRTLTILTLFSDPRAQTLRFSVTSHHNTWDLHRPVVSVGYIRLEQTCTLKLQNQESSESVQIITLVTNQIYRTICSSTCSYFIRFSSFLHWRQVHAALTRLLHWSQLRVRKHVLSKLEQTTIYMSLIHRVFWRRHCSYS